MPERAEPTREVSDMRGIGRVFVLVGVAAAESELRVALRECHSATPQPGGIQVLLHQFSMGCPMCVERERETLIDTVLAGTRCAKRDTGVMTPPASVASFFLLPLRR